MNTIITKLNKNLLFNDWYAKKIEIFIFNWIRIRFKREKKKNNFSRKRYEK